MSNVNVLCSCDGFDWADNLSCIWIITDNWSILAIEDSFVTFVGKVDIMLQEFYFCDSLKQSIKLSFCGTSWNVILFPWFPIDQRLQKKMQAPDLLFLVSSQQAKSLSVKVSSSEFPAALSIGESVTGPLAQSLGKEQNLVQFWGSWLLSSQCPVSSSWIWKELGKLTRNMVLSR